MNIPYTIKTHKPILSNYISYHKRKGGTYLYSNVPESMPESIINTCLMENRNLKGKCFITFEHNNKTGHDPIYMGYLIKNDNKKDIKITILNSGYQVDGGWLGEKSWMDYYGVTYKIDLKGLNEDSLKWFNDYLNFDLNHKANPVKVETITLKPNEYLYIIGGTKGKAKYVNQTANKEIHKGCCVNGNALFYVKGKATGRLVVYDNEKAILDKNCKVFQFQKHYDGDDMGGRIGKANHHGVIDSNSKWIIKDKTIGKLKISYFNKYANVDLDKTYKPNSRIKHNHYHLIKDTSWYTHLSSQYHHNYIGLDMVKHTTTMNDKKLVLSVNKANPMGKIWDYGNWMIEYQDNMYLINKSNIKKKLSFYIENPGSLFYIIKDKNENILDKGVTMLTCTGKKPIYTLTIDPKEKRFISIQYVLPANDNGSIVHYIEAN